MAKSCPPLNLTSRLSFEVCQPVQGGCGASLGRLRKDSHPARPAPRLPAVGPLGHLRWAARATLRAARRLLRHSKGGPRPRHRSGGWPAGITGWLSVDLLGRLGPLPGSACPGLRRRFGWQGTRCAPCSRCCSAAGVCAPQAESRSLRCRESP